MEKVEKKGDKDVLVESSGGKTYTVDDAVNNAGYGKFQMVLTCISGMGWTADAFEVIILSIIGDMLACQWSITNWQNSLLTSSVFFGMMLGSPVFGTLADMYGRKKALLGSMALLFGFGCLSAASPSYPWIVSLRTFMGFALGGIPQALTLCCEYFPIRIRAKAGFFLCYYWAVGTIGVILVSWLIMVNLDSWRLLLVVASLPALCVALSFWWYPESARYYLVSDQYDEAEKILEKMIKMNKKEMPEGHLIRNVTKAQRGKITDLFKPEYRLSILLFWYIWFAIAFTYYGIAFMSPHVIREGTLKPSQSNKTFSEDMTTVMECHKMDTPQFVKLLWTSSAELPGLIVFTFLVEKIDRKYLLAGSCFTVGTLVGLMLIQTSAHVLILFFLFGARAIALAIFQHIFIMTSETFPTSVRAIAMGSSSSWCRLGGILAPLFSQVLLIKDPSIAIAVFVVIVFVCGGAALFLPIETRGRNMT